jgi:hypothetical protein
MPVAEQSKHNSSDKIGGFLSIFCGMENQIAILWIRRLFREQLIEIILFIFYLAYTIQGLSGGP